MDAADFDRNSKVEAKERTVPIVCQTIAIETIGISPIADGLPAYQSSLVIMLCATACLMIAKTRCVINVYHQRYLIRVA